MEFIQKYARVEGSDVGNGDDMENAREVGNISDDNFIDDTETEARDQDDLTSYRLINVTRDLQEALRDYSMSKNLRVCSDPENFVSDQLDGIEYNFDKFKGFEKIIKNFTRELQLFKQDLKESLYFAVLYGTYYNLLEKKRVF